MPRCRCLELGAALLLAATFATTLARAGDRPLEPEARAHVDRGLEAYADKRYDEAIRELEAAYRIDPRREILFNWAQAERLSGDCAAATPLYERFLVSRPPAAQAAQARRLIEKCRGAAPSERGDEPTREAAEAAEDEKPIGAVIDPWDSAVPPGGQTDGPGSSPPEDREPAVTAWYRDWLGDGLVAVGAVSLTVGVVFFARSSVTFDEAQRSWPDFDRLYEEGRSQRRIGVVGLAAGGVLLAARGVVRWIGVARADGGLKAAVAPLPGGAALVWGGHF